MSETLQPRKESFTFLLENVIRPEMCTRCGMCVGVCPHGVLDIAAAAYPVLVGECVSCGFCTACCPGLDVDYPALSRQVFDATYDPAELQGHVEQLYVAHPNDSTIRDAGASGGMVTGILDHLLTAGEIDGAVIVGMDSLLPYKTRGVLATTGAEIQACAQSKYCVTPSLAVLRQLRRLKGRYAVVALPCQVHALRKMQLVDRGLASRIRYILGLYCHCNMEVNGPEEAIEASGIPLAEVAAFQFRGGGWPGSFFVIKKDGTEIPLQKRIQHKDVMNVMFRLYGPKRCLLCVDALSEYADLSFGDFWAFDFAGDMAGLERCTLVSQRTAAGRELMGQVQRSGRFVVHPLPGSRNPKRTLRMARGKKNRAYVGLHAAMAGDRPHPAYHFAIPRPAAGQRWQVWSFRLFQRIKHRWFRMVVLKLLFSPLGVLAYRVNTLRKKILIDYHA